MPITTPSTPATQFSNDPAAQTHVIAVSGGGRTAIGDRRPGAKPAPPALGPVQAPPPAPAPLGCSGYRIKHGTSDEAIVGAIREHARQSVAEAEGSPWSAVSSLTDQQLLAVIGWSFIAETACSKVAEHLSGLAS